MSYIKQTVGLMVVFVATSAFAATTYTEKVDGITWTYTVENGCASVGGGSLLSTAVPSSTSGAITIPPSLGGHAVASIGFYAFGDCRRLTSVTIPDSVTSIGSSAFEGCSGLTSVTIPDGVTSIGDYAFRECSGLTNVTIGAGVTSVGKQAFSECDKLASFEVDTVNPCYMSANGLLLSKDGAELVVGVVKNGSGIFADGVTSVGSYAFCGRHGLTNVAIPDSVTNIGSYAFQRCNALRDVIIPQYICAKGLSSVFPSCYQTITNVVISGNVTSIGNSAFSGCSGLAGITIPDSVTNIGSSEL